jgi:deoxyribodipyrimidine photo-lyase
LLFAVRSIHIIFECDSKLTQEADSKAELMGKTVVNPKRVRQIRVGNEVAGPVVYWMSRDQRLADNWALLYAQQLALEYRSPMAIVFCLVPEFLDATIRQYEFMLGGLEEVASNSKKYGIPFFMVVGEPRIEIPRFVNRHGIGTLVSDFSPLRFSRRWKDDVAEKIKIPFHEVDAHNIVPCWVSSGKQEYAAYTLRPKLRSLLPEFLVDFPRLKRYPYEWRSPLQEIDWMRARKPLKVDGTVLPVDWIMPGEKAAVKMLSGFLDKRLAEYVTARNDPTRDGQSNLSPYLHFGQISAQRVAWRAQRHDKHLASQEAFLEELIIRRELADNFCLYNPNYYSFDGFPKWAQATLNEHRSDPRSHIYGLEEFETAQTHDDLWNAAQLELVQTGKMHGYLRMFWAKKILEWTISPEQALEIAIYLNDRYSIDGRDPNGYAGVAWSVGGVHDRPWFERDIFGKIRYMSRSGCERKFDVKAYIARHLQRRGKTRK